MSKEEISTPTKIHTSKINIVRPQLCPHEKTHAEKISEQMKEDPSDTIKTCNTKKKATEKRKRTTTQADESATCLDVNSMPSLNKKIST